MKLLSVANQDQIENSPLKLREQKIPEINDNEVLIRVSACGVCRTDLHIIEGDLPLHKCPITPGHEAVGTIVETGSQIEEFKIGDRVGLAWVNLTCTKCKFCKMGKTNLCLSPAFTGWDIDGGYAEFIKTATQYLYKLPPEITDETVAPLLCSGIIGWRTLKKSKFYPGSKIGIYGFGASAHICAQIATKLGAEVYVFTRSEKAKALASDLGAKGVFDTFELPSIKLDQALIFAPAGRVVAKALEDLDRGATLVIAGIYLTDIERLNYENQLFYEKQIKSVTANTYLDGQELLKLCESLDIKPTISLYNLKDASKALSDLKHSKLSGAAVLVTDA